MGRNIVKNKILAAVFGLIFVAFVIILSTIVLRDCEAQMASRGGIAGIVREIVKPVVIDVVRELKAIGEEINSEGIKKDSEESADWEQLNDLDIMGDGEHGQQNIDSAIERLERFNRYVYEIEKSRLMEDVK